MKKSNFLASFGKNTQRKSSVKFWKKELHQKKTHDYRKKSNKKSSLVFEIYSSRKKLYCK